MAGHPRDRRDARPGCDFVPELFRHVLIRHGNDEVIIRTPSRRWTGVLATMSRNRRGSGRPVESCPPGATAGSSGTAESSNKAPERSLGRPNHDHEKSRIARCQQHTNAPASPSARQLSLGSKRTPASSVYRSPVCGQRQVPLPDASRRTPARPTHPIQRAGVPATRAKSGTSRVTTAPAATSAERPTEQPATITARAPSDAPSRTTTPRASQSAGRLSLPDTSTDRGYISFVRMAAGPMKTLSSSRAGS